jgi:hypothetical protein
VEEALLFHAILNEIGGNEASVLGEEDLSVLFFQAKAARI